MDPRPGQRAGEGPSSTAKALALVGLAGLAITQPVLDLLGQNPEFFVAGRYTSSQIVELGLLTALVPPLVLVAVFAVAHLAHRRAGDAVHAVLLAALGALFGNVVLRGVGLDGLGAAVVASLLGAGAVTLLARVRPGQLLLQYLAVANVAFLAGFLVVSPTSRLLGGGGDPEAVGSVSVPTPPGPVVVIVFDELPLSTLMRSDGTINAERYPSFARLAAGSTWFRNASSVHARTERAVPALMTGVVREAREMPTYRELPHNLLALMAAAVPVERYEAVTDLCPPEACEPRPGQPLRQAVEDSLIVYGHRVLPPTLRKGLPRIDDAWGGFGNGPAEGALVADDGDDAFAEDDPLARYRGFEASERDPRVQAGRLVQHARAIDATPALHFVHIVTPHSPWSATPWGTRVMEPWPDWVEDDPAQPGYDWSALIRYQRHSLQTGSLDVALGEVLDHLEESDLWEDTTLVVAADHGISTIPPDFGRDPTDANEDEVYRVPLFVKAAGQEEPEVVDEVAMTIDVLPTLIDLLGIGTDWEMDGHSLLDGSPRTAEPLVRTDLDPLYDLVRRHESDFPRGSDWTALAAVGEHGALVGTPVADLEVGTPSALRWAPNHEDTFASLPTEQGETPQVMTGRISTPDGREPPALVIVANGTVAAVTGGYQRRGEEWSFSSTLGPFLVAGVNQIDAYEVTGGTDRAVLHRLG